MTHRRPASRAGRSLLRFLPTPSWRNRRLTPSAAALVAANLVLVLGVIAFGWDAYLLVMLYWAENIVVGVYAELRMLFARGGETPEGCGTKAGLLVFFLVHYGGFAAGHWVFLYFLFHRPGSPGIVAPEFVVALAALALSHGVSFVKNYLGGAEYRRVRAGDLFVAPYRRVVVLHVVIIVGAMPVMAFGSPMPGLVVLALVKTIVDWGAHEREHEEWRVEV